MRLRQTEADKALIEDWRAAGGGKPPTPPEGVLASGQPPGPGFRAQSIGAAVDVATAARAFKTAADFSRMLRQSIILAPGRPLNWLKSNRAYILATFSGKAADATEAARKAHPDYALARAAGLYEAPMPGQNVPLYQRTEEFQSRFADKIPIIKQSERGYVVAGNVLRDATFSDIVQGWRAAGKTYAVEDLKKLAAFINHADGRGTGKWLDNNAATLAQVLFSPRWLVSRFQVFGDLLTATPAVRKEAAKTLAAFIGVNVGILGIAKMSGVADTDPFSSSFGRVNIGGWKYDVWGGEQSIVRPLIQGIAGQRSAADGTTYDISRKGVAVSTLRSKLNPNAGAIWDLLEGKDFMGKPVNVTSIDGSTRLLRNLYAPIVAENMYRAFQAEGLVGLAKDVPEPFGASVTQPRQTAWQSFEEKVKETYGGRSYNELSPREKQEAAQDLGKPPPSTPAFAAAEERKAEWTKQQKRDDRELAASEISPDEWKDNLRKRQLTLSARRDELFKDLPEGKDKDALDRYFEIINQHTIDRTTGEKDWDAIDREVARLPRSDLRAIAENTGLGDTATKRAYFDTQDKADSTGFWDQKDQAWAALQQKHPGKLDNWDTYSDWQQAAMQAGVAQGIAGGLPKEQARMYAEKLIEKSDVPEAFSEMWRNGARHQWVESNPDLAASAAYWGFFTPDKAERDFLLRYGLAKAKAGAR